MALSESFGDWSLYGGRSLSEGAFVSMSHCTNTSLISYSVASKLVGGYITAETVVIGQFGSKIVVKRHLKYLTSECGLQVVCNTVAISDLAASRQ